MDQAVKAWTDYCLVRIVFIRVEGQLGEGFNVDCEPTDVSLRPFFLLLLLLEVFFSSLDVFVDFHGLLVGGLVERDDAESELLRQLGRILTPNDSSHGDRLWNRIRLILRLDLLRLDFLFLLRCFLSVCCGADGGK